MSQTSTKESADNTTNNSKNEPKKIGRFTVGFMNDPEIQIHYDNTARPTDVIINTMGKTGQTMLQCLLLAMKFKGDFTGIKTLFDGSPWLECNFPVVVDGKLVRRSVKEVCEAMDALPDPRVFKQHVWWEEVGRSVDPKIQSQIKYITILRDIRDLPYSWHCHVAAFTVEACQFLGIPPAAKQQSFAATFDQWIESKTRWQWMRSFWEHRNDDNVLVLRFSQVLKDKKGTAIALAKFLNWPVPSDEELEEKILPACSLEWMKANQSTFVTPIEIFDGAFVREGKVGANKQRLNDDQLRRLREKCEAELCPELVKMMYCEDL